LRERRENLESKKQELKEIEVSIRKAGIAKSRGKREQVKERHRKRKKKVE
jgi:hypothetical protein